ncbi:TonB-dependent receptor plug domain-containing protein [Sphingomonas adhaesiva]|uniref:TonB-dependent receptor plug domain-containing protein n=1 Tax=Sphingomonas adhaesiva TaxID=28212 RepID=UPI002FF715B6
MTIERQFDRRKAFLAGFASMAALAVSLPAAAQEAAPTRNTATAQAPEPASDSGEAGPDVVVTGTRIVRSGFEAPTPLTVLSREDIQNGSPSNNIADFVNQLPALAGSTRPSNSRLNLSSGQAGINALNLRNLGPERTLVLLDGRRSVPSTINGLVDINTLPQALIERVEVVTGGASAAYGSDAVAGVVNFVLNKKYQGLKVAIDSGITEEGDGGNYSFQVAGGTSFAGGRGHILLSGEVAHRDGIFSVDRDWNQIGFLRFENPAYNAATNSSVPQYIFVRGAGPTNSTPGGIITNSAGTTPNALRGLYFGPGGQPLQYQYGALTFPAVSGSAAPARTVGGDWRVNDTGRRIGLDPLDDRYGVFGRVSFEVADGVELFAEGAYNRQHVFFNAGPNLSTGAVLNATGCSGAATAATAPLTCNAFLYNTLGPARLQGVTSVTVATSFADLPFRAVDNKREAQRYAVGAEGDLNLFGKRSPWNVYAQYGRVDTREQLRNIQNVTRLNNATSVAFAPVGNAGGYAPGSIQCLVNLNASTADDDRACVPLNRLGLGVANPAAIPYVLGDPYREQRLQQITAGANLSLTPFATWAGDVSIAVGAEYREEKVSGFVPSEFQPVPVRDASGNVTGATNRWSVGNYLASVGRYDVKEAYLETAVPLGFGLEFNGAARATDYSTAGYVTTWKAGATWQPIEDIRLRVTRSRDIRAPNLNDLFQAGAANSDSVTNPGFQDGRAPAFIPAGQPPQSGYSYSGFATGNTRLGPEKSDQWNVGAVLTPRFLPGFNLSVDYFDIKVRDGISTFSAQQIVNLCYLGNTDFCDAVSIDQSRTQNPAQPYLIIGSQPFNAASQKVRGVDIDASYRLPLDRLFGETNGAVTVRGIATRYIDNLFDSGVPQSIVLNSVGVNSGQTTTPTWIYRASVAVDTDDFSITAVGRGVSAGKYAASGIECQTTCPVATTNVPTYQSNRIDGVFYADLNLTQKVRFDGAEAEFFVNVTNLFNRDPMLLPETGLAANSTYSDLLGRQFRIGIRMETR